MGVSCEESGAQAVRERGRERVVENLQKNYILGTEKLIYPEMKTQDRVKK